MSINFGLDNYANLRSPLHAWEPRLKLIGFLALIFAFAFVRSLYLLPAMVLVTAGLYALSQLPWSFLWQRLQLPGFFLLGVVAVLPFLSGETVLWQVGPVVLRQEGLLSVVLIATRFVSILTLGLILFGTAPFIVQIRAMRSLGLPPLLADMTLLAYRYLYETAEALTTMRTAMRLRGFQARRLNHRNLTMLTSLTGSLLVRSYDQSEQVYQAMRLRGYGQSVAYRWQGRIRRQDSFALGCLLCVAAGFAIAEFWLSVR